MKAATLIVALLALTASLGCAHKVKVITSPPGASITVDGKKVGKSPVIFEESPLPGSHRIVARLDGYHQASVVVERTEVNWWWVAGGLTGCVLCYGPGCLAGAALANLSLCPACLVAGATCNPGPVSAILAAPGLLTVPLVSLGSLLGASPLALLALSEQSRDQVKMTLKKK